MRLSRGRNRRRPSGSRWRLPEISWPACARAAGAIALVTALVGLVAAGLDRPLRRIVVRGAFERVTPLEVEQVARRALDGGFASADLDVIRTALEGLTWVDRARIERRWPDQLVIEIVEQQAAARWGEDGLLNTRGELFATGVLHPPPELPRLDGPPGTESQVAQRYLAVQGRLFEQGLRPAALSVDARGAWQLGLLNGVTVRLGRRQVDERMDRFLAVAAGVIAGRAAEIRYLDLRYSNGFAIGWNAPRPAPAAADGASDHHADRETDG
ncbi:MAG: FtsQ-type POTRA domain-containing protein [Gammaproteobacteria bacterium]|nr:FtsQ-type POTRA domain-containing protein [Gammaproteobacteria bacterium]